VNDKLNPAIYTMPVVLERVRQHGDLFAGVLTTRQSLTKALRSLL
jgi:DNA primase